jgi:hypothetical protein
LYHSLLTPKYDALTFWEGHHASLNKNHYIHIFCILVSHRAGPYPKHGALVSAKWHIRRVCRTSFGGRCWDTLTKFDPTYDISKSGADVVSTKANDVKWGQHQGLWYPNPWPIFSKDFLAPICIIFASSSLA